ncbi:hypothetical protein L3Q82_016486, partial [Scortum barcoo]
MEREREATLSTSQSLDGDVILESPAVPVMEQQTVTLHCRKKTTSSNPPADFYKEDHFIKTGYKGKIVFHNVSKFNEGLYKCSISGPSRTITRELDGRQSNLLLPHLKRQQLKRVRKLFLSLHTLVLFSSPSCYRLSSAFCVWLCCCWWCDYCDSLHFRKQRVACFSSEVPTTQSDPVVPAFDHVTEADPDIATYANVVRHKKKRAYKHATEDDPQMTTYVNVTRHKKKRGCRNANSANSSGDQISTVLRKLCLNAFLQRPQCQELIRVKQVKTQTMYDDPAVRIVPSRLQLFEYKSVSFDCEGLNTTAGWRVVRKVKGKVSVCVSTWVKTAASVCAIKPAYPTDSGEYWCEAGEERSSAVNISITAGSVILESPAQPVMEGDSVTLRCRSRMTSSAHIADFYKDGLLVGSGSTGEMTIRAVSKSDEGLYKCSISDFGESPESWLAVRRFR